MIRVIEAFFTISFSGIAESHLDNCTEQVRDEAKRSSELRSGRKREGEPERSGKDLKRGEAKERAREALMNAFYKR